MSEIFRYSIVRFQPFADLGEFANIGVLAINAHTGEAAFRLARKRFARLHDFFGDDAYRAYAPAIEYLRAELARIEVLGNLGGGREALALFDHTTRVHESTIIFSEVRVVMASSGITSLVENLFARLVMRQLQEGNELNLIGGIRSALRHNGIKNFKVIRLDDDIVPVTFPIARKNGRLKAIHPLAFTQKTPLAVFDHGALWKKRLGYLLDHNKIDDDSVLLVVEKPEGDVPEAIHSAYEEAMKEISALPFDRVAGEVDGHINQRIIDFAASASRDQRMDWSLH